MSGPWALKIGIENARRAVKVRTLPGVQAAVDGDSWWLRGDDRDKDAAAILSVIADGPVYNIAPSDLLIPVGSLVPTERLPKLDWRPLREMISLTFPGPAVARVRVAKARLQLVRSTFERPANILLCEFSAFAAWADMASEIRLHACRFAVTQAYEGLPMMAVVNGTPLPPVPGRRFWLTNNVAIPSGFEWTPAVDEATLRAAVATAFDACPDSAIILWNVDSVSDAANASGDRLELVAQTDFITATRSNVRATLETALK